MDCSEFNLDIEKRRKKIDKFLAEEEKILETQDEDDDDLEDLSFDFLAGFGKDLKVKATSVVLGDLTEDQKNQISCVFNPLDSKQAIADANKRPDLGTNHLLL